MAVNQHHHRRRKDLERTLFAKLVEQTGEKVNGYNQGLYFFTPSGKLLSFSNTLDGNHAWKLLRRAKEKFEPAEGLPKLLQGHEKAGPLWTLPDGSQLVLVTTKVLSGYEKASTPNRRIHQKSLGRNHLWLSKSEIEALAKGTFPQALRNRLPGLLNDNSRGEPGHWRQNEIKTFDITLDKGQLTGQLHFETASGTRGYKADLLGYIEAKQGRLTRFDIVVRGTYWGEGRYTRNAPKGEFPFAVSFRLSDGTEAHDVPPPGAR